MVIALATCCCYVSQSSFLYQRWYQDFLYHLLSLSQCHIVVLRKDQVYIFNQYVDPRNIRIFLFITEHYLLWRRKFNVLTFIIPSVTLHIVSFASSSFIGLLLYEYIPISSAYVCLCSPLSYMISPSTIVEMCICRNELAPVLILVVLHIQVVYLLICTDLFLHGCFFQSGKI